MNNLNDNVLDIIHSQKHQLKFKDVMDELIQYKYIVNIMSQWRCQNICIM